MKNELTHIPVYVLEYTRGARVLVKMIQRNKFQSVHFTPRVAVFAHHVLNVI